MSALLPRCAVEDWEVHFVEGIASTQYCFHTSLSYVYLVVRYVAHNTAAKKTTTKTRYQNEDGEQHTIVVWELPVRRSAF